MMLLIRQRFSGYQPDRSTGRSRHRELPAQDRCSAGTFRRVEPDLVQAADPPRLASMRVFAGCSLESSSSSISLPRGAASRRPSGNGFVLPPPDRPRCRPRTVRSQRAGYPSARRTWWTPCCRSCDSQVPTLGALGQLVVRVWAPGRRLVRGRLVRPASADQVRHCPRARSCRRLSRR
jgi:hypothetical protein